MTLKTIVYAANSRSGISGISGVEMLPKEKNSPNKPIVTC